MTFHDGECVEIFCAVSELDSNTCDYLFVSELQEGEYFLLKQQRPFFDVEITNRAIFDAIVSGLQKLGLKQRELKII